MIVLFYVLLGSIIANYYLTITLFCNFTHSVMVSIWLNSKRVIQVQFFNLILSLLWLMNCPPLLPTCPLIFSSPTKSSKKLLIFHLNWPLCEAQFWLPPSSFSSNSSNLYTCVMILPFIGHGSSFHLIQLVRANWWNTNL